MTLDIEALNKTGDELFERIIKALLMKVIGRGVTPFSKGQDGAREAIFVGKASYPSEIENWSGKWIFQVKHSDISNGVDKARNQVKYLINNELKKLEGYGFVKNSNCDNYIYITNVPFTGKANTGMHDYILRKKNDFKIRNFDYWDGEKVLTLLSSYPVIRETFFATKGLVEIEAEKLKRNSDLFVEPIQYKTLKDRLLSDRILNIVGPPHVGKTSLAMYLGNEVLISKQLNKIWLVDIIDYLDAIPNVENCIIIFDDLYGDITYDQIGKKTKILTRLSEKNYIIITSRDYIFKSAEKESETVGSLKTELILQEGSYTTEMLIKILEKHAKRKLDSRLFSLKTYNLIINHKNHITQYLRFPHNLQVFVNLSDDKVRFNKDIERIIISAKHIENVIKKYVSSLDPITQKSLLIASLGKIYDLKKILTMSNFCWSHDRNDILAALEKHPSIITIDNDRIKFVHPSYKSSVTGFFKEFNRKLLNETVLNVAFNEAFEGSKNIYPELIYDAFNDLQSWQIIEIMETQDLPTNWLTNIWVILIRRNYYEALQALKRLMITGKKKEPESVFRGTFLSSKDFLKTKEVMDLINFFINYRAKKQDEKLVDHLIAHLCYKFKGKAHLILAKVNGNSFRDLKLKIDIIGAIGTLHPHRVYDELLLYAKHKNVGIRTAAYKAIMILARPYIDKATNALISFEKIEINKSSRSLLGRIIKGRLMSRSKYTK